MKGDSLGCFFFSLFVLTRQPEKKVKAAQTTPSAANTPIRLLCCCSFSSSAWRNSVMLDFFHQGKK
jgi:hypothetical protein